MTDDAGNLSIDFLAGFTIFLIAFIYIATLIPGLFIGLQSRTVDYDAVAYRTGVILVEDPGMPYNPAWETLADSHKGDMLRFGLAVSKDSPNILSSQKVDRFFCRTWSYPDDYRSRVIFGDYPYLFNISFQQAGSNLTRSIGDNPPDEYGYIRRVVKVKGNSNASIDDSKIRAYMFNSSDNVTTDVFSIHLNFTNLLGDEPDPAYQINPYNDQIMVNISGMNVSVVNKSLGAEAQHTTLEAIQICRSKPISTNPHPPVVCFANFTSPIVDNKQVDLPYPIEDNLSLIIPPGFITTDLADANTQLYFNLTFNHYDTDNVTLFPENGYLNNTGSGPFEYTYDPKNITLPKLQDGVLEVSVW
ncbi:hypothetical protein [Methanoregula sp. UBA64]|jgi:hypothetical protein|uniref:hypothetical protein n=1 Tax=Methanoregula sp. UBA64 TaxID=1915554 RepID=UPI0025E3040B|nr:hypothetical protein [Methanoregula sp. UBA64]